MWETPAGPAGGNDTALTTPVSAAAPSLGVAASDTCPTCGGAPGPGKTGRCATCIEEEWTKLRVEMGEEWYRRHRYREDDCWVCWLVKVSMRRSDW